MVQTLPAMRSPSGQLTCPKEIAVGCATALASTSVVRGARAAIPKKMSAFSPSSPIAEIPHGEFRLAFSGAAAGNLRRGAVIGMVSRSHGRTVAADLGSSHKKHGYRGLHFTLDVSTAMVTHTRQRKTIDPGGPHRLYSSYRSAGQT